MAFDFSLAGSIDRDQSVRGATRLPNAGWTAAGRSRLAIVAIAVPGGRGYRKKASRADTQYSIAGFKL
jgi:hypothetical protein